jgi:ATP-binding cassette subfamily B multidrug efflux pump
LNETRVNRIHGIVRRPFERIIAPLVDAPVTRPPDTLLAFYRHFLEPVKWTIAAVLVVSLITAVTEMGLFVFLGWIVDQASSTPPENFFRDHAWALLGMSLVVLFLRPLNALMSRSLMQLGLIPALTFSVRWQSYRYVLRQSLAFFQNDFAGRVAQKVLQTGPSLRETVAGSIEGLWTLLIYVGGTLWLFAAIDLWLIAPIALWSIAYGIVVFIMVPPVRARSSAVSEANSGVSGRVVDGYSNIQSVKLFAHAEREDAFAFEGFRRHLDAYANLAGTVANLTVTLTIINSVLIFSVGGLALWLWSAGAITVGAIALAVSLVIRLNQMSGWILRTITGLFESVGAVQNGMQMISQPYAVVDAPGARPLAVTEGEIRFENVSFHYGREGGVIDNLSLVVKPGERVGLVGRSGAGKSTLVSLLLRFYDLEAGRIVIDGQDIANVTQESLRANIGVVTQDTSLLHRSIRDNIRYGRPEASEPEIVAAAKRAEADGFIVGLHDFNDRTGYDAHVGERGVKLSGGQRQRVAIARLILKDAPILVLDEATSALDSEVEAIIQEQLYSLMEGRTVLAIAHRLSTIAVLDRLVIMDEGRIVETGTHQELLARGGLYAKLWRRQSGGFLGLDPAGEQVAAE